MITNVRDARRIFNEEVKPLVIEQYGKDDRPALEEAWNDWTDMLYKDGVISAKAYQNWTRV